MAVDGIWRSELYGLFGWETTGVLILEKGRLIGGGHHHYSVGTYEDNGEDVNMTWEVEYYGTPRTVFGSSDKHFSVSFNGKLEDGTIEGPVFRTDRPKHYVSYRLTKKGDLPGD